MSSSNLQGACGKKAIEGLEKKYDVDSVASSSGHRSSNINIQSAKQKSTFVIKLNRMNYRPASALDSSPADIEENKLIHQRVKEHWNVASVSSQSMPGASSSHQMLHKSNQSTPDNKKSVFQNPASEHKEKADQISSSFKPAPFKEFTLSPSKLPFTKEQLSESLSLEEACGLLPNLMKTKRDDLRGIENELDQVSVDLQTALLDAKKICILLENAPKDVPQDINAARVQAQKLMYLLSTSFRVFEKLDRWGGALKEGVKLYSKEAGDFHSSVDSLLEYIMDKILEKCKQIEETRGVLV